MSSPSMAKRTHGVCQGSLWRQHDNKQNRRSKSSSSRVYEYCVLVGVRMSTYETLQAYRRGDPPVVTYGIVGASSAISTDRSRFRLVTDQGTHVNCTAPTSSCRDVWLSALLAGLERRLMILANGDSTSGNNTTGNRGVTSLDQPRLPKVKPPSRYRNLPGKFCNSCGKIERLEFLVLPASAPLSQYGTETRADLCLKCCTAQGMLDHVQMMRELYASSSQERQALQEARQLCLTSLLPPDHYLQRRTRKMQLQERNTNDQDEKDKANEEDNNSREERDVDEELQISDICLTQNSNWALGQVMKKNPQFAACQRVSPVLESLVLQYQQGIVDVMEFCELLDHAVGRRDDSLKDLKKQAIRAAGDMGTAMKLLFEQTLPHQLASSTPHSLSLSSSSASDDGSTEMLQCLLEFLMDLALDGELNALAFFWPQLCHVHLQMLPPGNTAELARVELMEDFLLTVATRHSIHLAIELIWSHCADLEDANVACGGLLSGTSSTVAEASDESTRIRPECRKRRFAVLRFLCELESLLFDFEHGWGGGSMCVGSMMSPSIDQNRLLREGMLEVQSYRRASPHQLSRSVRREKLAKDRYKSQEQRKQHKGQEQDAGNSSHFLDNSHDDHDCNNEDLFSPERMAQEALRIAKNADYVSSHLAFTKRLCDIAERLRFMPVEERSPALSAELAKLNASGAMGGDPLNKVRQNSNSCYTHNTARVVRIPTTEGHVFRSKERTPVLLLMETLDEAAYKDDDDDFREKSKNDVSQGAVQEAESKGGQTRVTSNGETTKGVTKVSDESNAEECDPRPKDGSNEAGGQGERKPDESQPEEKIDGQQETPKAVSAQTRTTNATNDDGDVESDYHTAADKDEYDFSLQDGSKVDGADLIDGVEGTTLFPRKTSVDSSLDLEGSLSVFEHENHHALRRFDSPIKGESTIITPPASKVLVEELVTNVVAKQLHLPNLVHPAGGEDTQQDEQKDEEKDDYVKRDTLSNGDSDCSMEPKRGSKKMSALGGFGAGDTVESTSSLAITGDTRREVLTTIMTKGMRGSNTIAAGAATAVTRQLKELERRRAVELLLTGEDPKLSIPADGLAQRDPPHRKDESSRQELLSLGIRSASTDNLEGEYISKKPSEEDEVMEAVRLLLIQYRVAQGTLSLGDAAEALAPARTTVDRVHVLGSTDKVKFDPRRTPRIDAGDVDARLIGCGVLPPAVLQALTLWKGGMVTNGELLELVKKDLEYVRHSLVLEEKKDKLIEDSVFWGRFAFGERWAEKQSRIAATSPEASQAGWDLLGAIIKSNDDLRQESFVMQLIELCLEAFQEAGLELWLHPYRILSTGRSTGIIEMVRNAMSFDALKKRPGYGKGGLREHLQRMTDFAADPGEAFRSAQQNFVRSLAAYSLLSYLFLFKDRHNGNLLLDTAGHVIHIDFGFVFGVAPGGSFSLEMSTPFKLTEEMIDVMDGLQSSLFSEFVTLFCCGFLALQAHSDTFLTIVEITCTGSSFKCFEGRTSSDVVASLRDRLRPDLGKEETIAFALDIIKQSTTSYGTAQYDYFQYLSQGIAT